MAVPTLMKKVHATELDIDANGLVLPNGLRVAEVRIALPQASVDVDPFMLPEGTAADIEVTVTAKDLQDYLNRKRPAGMTDFRVKAEDGNLTVVGIMRMILAVEVGAEGKLEFANGKLNFVPTRAEMGGVKAPDKMVREQLDKLNPLIDLTGWPVETKLKGIEIGGGQVRLTATLTSTAPIPRRAP